MANEIGKGYIAIEPDAKGFGSKAEKQVGSELKGVGTKAGKQVGQELGDGIGDGIKGSTSKLEGIGGNIGKALTAGIGVLASVQIGRFVNDAIHQASDLEQAVGGTAAVFKDAAGQIDAFAKTSADSVGLSEAAFRQMTSRIGGSLKGFGFDVDEAAKKSIELVTIGADLAATFGGTTEEAVTALGAALRGEFDPLERFSIALTASAVAAKAVELGLADSTAQVTGTAKAQATLALIMERSADAQGQFAREADTTAGAAQRAAAAADNAKAKFGEALLPVMTKVHEVVTFVAEGFAALPAPLQLAAVGLAGVAAVAPALNALTQIVQRLLPASLSTGSAMSVLGKSLGVIGVAAGAAIIVYEGLSAEKNRLKAATEALTTALRGEDGALKASALGDFVASKFEKFAGDLNRAGVSYQQLVGVILTGERPASEAFQKLVNNTDGFNLALNETRFALAEQILTQYQAAKAAGELTAAEEAQVEAFVRAQAAAAGFSETDIAGIMEKWRAGTLSGEDAFRNLGAALDLINQVAPPAAAATAQAGTAMANAGAQSSVAATEYRIANAALNEQTAAANATNTAIQNLMTTQTAAFNSALAWENAVDGVHDALVTQQTAAATAAKAVQEHGSASTEAATAANAASDADRALRGAILQAGAAAVKAAEDQAAYSGKTLDAKGKTDAWNGALDGLAQSFPGLRDQVQGYKVDINGIPTQKPTDVTVSDHGTANAVKTAVLDIPTSRQVTITVSSNISSVAAAISAAARAAASPIFGSAGGNYFDRPSLTTIAEVAPEVVLNGRQATRLLWEMANSSSRSGGSDRPTTAKDFFAGTGGPPVPIQLVADGRVLAETVYEPLRLEERRRRT